MNVLEELWYGNVSPSEYDTTPCMEALRLVTRNEEKLKAALTDEQKELLARYTESVQELQSITECIIFQTGFRLGGRIIIEVLAE